MPRKPADYEPDPRIVCRAALARGPLVKDRWHFRFGNRRFHGLTIARLVAAGEAKRRDDGSVVRADAP